MKTKLVILIIALFGIEPFLFYFIQLGQFQDDLLIYPILKGVLFLVLFVGLIYLYAFSLTSIYSYFENKNWYSYEQLSKTIINLFFLILSILPILIISKVDNMLENFKQIKISQEGKITTALIHYKQGEHYTNKGGPKHFKFINYFDVTNRNGKTYELEFYEKYDIFNPGDSILVQYLETNPTYFKILKKYPSDE